MNTVLVGVVSVADFERAQDQISELSNYCDYHDWLDCRYGHLMGLSLGGADASLVTVALDDFLKWCSARKIRSSEAALDAYARHSRIRSRREPLSAA
jgi:hypothetical protein